MVLVFVIETLFRRFAPPSPFSGRKTSYTTSYFSPWEGGHGEAEGVFYITRRDASLMRPIWNNI